MVSIKRAQYFAPFLFYTFVSQPINCMKSRSKPNIPFPSLKFILVMKLFGLSLFGCKTSNVIEKGSETSGPFEIVWDVTESRSGAWYNNGGDPNAKQFTSYFNINYKGAPLKVTAKEK